jgi:hypothetical protein
MEEVTEAVSNLSITEPHKKNRIQVSNTKKPLFFYVNLAKVRIPPPVPCCCSIFFVTGFCVAIASGCCCCFVDLI